MVLHKKIVLGLLFCCGSFDLTLAEGFLSSSDQEKIHRVAVYKGFVAGVAALVCTALINYGKTRLAAVPAIESSVIKNVKTTFADVVGHTQAKQNLKGIVDVFQNFSKYLEKNVSIPCGVVLHGPSGSGKTLLAHALAGETESIFIDLSGSDVGKAVENNEQKSLAAIVREVKKCEKAIIFLGALNNFKLSFAEKLLKQVCPMMYKKAQPVMLVGEVSDIKNIKKDLDQAEEFNIHTVYVRKPRVQDRKAMIEGFIARKKISFQADIDKIAKRIDPAVYKELQRLVDKAYYKAILDNRAYVTTQDFDQAIEEMEDLIGLYDHEHTDKNDLITAYHESGHAIVLMLHPDCDISNFYKITVKNKFDSSGLVYGVGTENNDYFTKKRFLGRIAWCLAGAAAEEIFVGEFRTGVQSDFQQATNCAYRMIARFGMSDEFGKVIYDWKTIKSNEDAQKLVKKILDEQYEVAKQIILENKDKFELLAKTVYEKKVLYAREVHELLGTVDRSCVNDNAISA